MHNAVAGSQALLQVIQDAGLFTQHGLAVEIGNATPRATTAALLAGDVPLMVSSGIHAVSAGLAGGDTVIVSGGISTLDSSLWTREPLAPAGLRGRRIGVSTFGDAADFAARFAAKRWGLDPTRDLEILQTGQPSERLAALQAGAVDATIIQPPLTTVARKAGLYQLAEMADLGLEYQHTGVVTTRARLATDADVLERFVGAWAEGVYYYRARPDVARAAVGRFMSLEDPDALAETYERYIKWYARPPYPTLSGIQSILDQLAEGEDPRARDARPEQFVDTRFLDKLSAAGQFQRWDQQYPAAP
ncbi:MAG TPA: ABC transporter substrate-binding protein [Chloroflexota bacterium]|nr:ABC transporter substrate-binding protein [Chloroflexota bacterium]